MNPGDVIKQDGRVMIFLFGDDVKKCLAVSEHGFLEVVRITGDVEKVEYEHLTTFLRNRLQFLNARYGEMDEAN